MAASKNLTQIGSHVMPMLSAVLVYGIAVSMRPVFPLQLMVLVFLVIPLLQAESYIRAALVSAVFGAMLGALLLFGTHHYGGILYGLAVLAVCAQFTLFGIICQWIKRRVRCAWHLPFLFATAYLVIDVACSRIPSMASPRFAGLFSYDVFWLQPIALLGSGGLAFGLMFINVLVAMSVTSGLSGAPAGLRSLRLPWGVALIALGATGVYGKSTLNGARDLGPEVELAIIQGNVLADEYSRMHKDPRIERSIIRRYMGLTEAAADAGYGIVLWPEAALDVPFMKAQNRLQQLAEAQQLELICGFNVAEGSVLRNAVLAIDRCGNVRDRYDKNLLIPLSESEYEPGDNPLPLQTSFGSVAAPVCWEAQFEYFVRRLVRRGAEAILVFSDESGFRSPAASRVILNQNILRAVENRRYVVRAAQSGISVVIDPFGRIVCSMGCGNAGFIGARIRLSDRESMATRLGAWWILLPVLGSVGIVATSRPHQPELLRI